jgi:hypothetical protein
MQPAQTRPSDTYSPLYFLASLGAGGLSVTFFMWLMHWIPHPGRTVPTFEDIAQAFGAGDLLTQAMILTAAMAIAFFVFLNLKSLVWNLKRYSAWTKTDAFAKFSKTNAQSQVMALPLALAMSVNGLFIIGLVFVPGLWSVIEYLFPLAIIAFLAIGALGLKLYGRFLGRVLTEGGFNCAANNNFGQVLPAFAFAMVAVGLAAPVALSTNATVAGFALVLSGFFFVLAAIIGVAGVLLGLRSMMENGVNKDTAPTLMISVPMMAVMGIAMLRQNHGMHVHFGTEGSAGESLSLLVKLVSVQVVFLMLGLLVLVRQGYAKRFLFGSENNAGAYALVCPGVGFAVLVHFLVNKGLVDAGVIAKFGVAYWGLTAIALASQAAMIWLVFLLNRRHFSAATPAQAVPAE